jgi:hypothetical protein
MRVLRRHGNDLNWNAKLVADYDKHDQHHKGAMKKLAEELIELAVTRNYYIDRKTILTMYDHHMAYDRPKEKNT